MRFLKGTFPRLPTGFPVQNVPWASATSGEGDDVTVGNGATVQIVPVGNRRFIAEIKNISQSGQMIRIGLNPSFATPSGLLLYPGDGVTLDNFFQTILAIANAAGGVINRSVWRVN